MDTSISLIEMFSIDTSICISKDFIVIFVEHPVYVTRMMCFTME